MPVTSGMLSSLSPEYETPQGFFARLDAEFHFTLDPAATPDNAKCERFYTAEDDGLSKTWVYPSKWVRELLPLKSLQLAHALIEALAYSKYFIGNPIAPESTSSVRGLELDSHLCFGPFGSEIWQKCCQNKDNLEGVNIPTPRNALTVLAGLLGGDGADTERVRKKVYGRLVYHLDLEVQGVTGAAPAASFGGTLFDMYAALAINDASTVGQNLYGNRGAFHDLIVLPIGGFVKDALGNSPATVFVNPPYGRAIGKWVKKGYEEAQRGIVVVMLVPARTDTRWWHGWVMKAKEIRFVKGRLRFGGGNSAPFPSAVVVYGRNDCGPTISTMEAK